MKTIVIRQIRCQKFKPVDDVHGILEWEELVERKGFRPRWVKRSIRKEYHKAANAAEESK